MQKKYWQKIRSNCYPSQYTICDFQLFLLKIILESNTKSVKWTINDSKSNVGTLGLSVIMWNLGSALISCNLFFVFSYSISEVEKNSTPKLPYIMRASSLMINFILLVKKKFRQKGFHNFIKNFFIVVITAVQKSFAFIYGPLDVVGNVKFLRMESICFLNLLIVDVGRNIGKNWVQNVVYKSKERNWCPFLFIRFLNSFCLF